MTWQFLIKDALITTGILSLVPLVAAGMVGLFVAVLQAATQIQEQTIGFLARLITASIVIIGGWSIVFSQLSELIRTSLTLIGAH